MLKMDKGSAILMVAVCGLGAMPLAADDASIRESIGRQTVSSQRVESDAEKKVREGNAAYGDGEYRKAIDAYLEAVKIMRSFKSAEFANRIAVCQAQINRCYYNMAQDAVAAAQEKKQLQDFDAAIALCKEAIAYYPECAPSVEKMIQDMEKRRAAVQVQTETGAETLIPDKAGQEYRIQVLMRQGQELMLAGNFQQAIRRYQDILLIDPYNAEALHNLRAANLRSTKTADDRYKNEHRKLITEVEWRWSTAIPQGEVQLDNAVDSPLKKEELDDTTGIAQKIRSIIIPRIDFEEVTIPTAIKFLQEESKRNDPEQVGVNIFLRRSAGLLEQQQPVDGMMPEDPAMADPAMAAAPPAAAMPAEGEEGAEGAEVDPEANEKKISLIITKKSLFDALRYLCDAAGLRMRVERYAVVVAPEHIALDDLETKIFPVEKSAFGDIDVEGNPNALKTFFVDRGIRFPSGSKIVYDTRISRLIVTNTIENLRLVDEVIQEILSDKDPMVEISAKFIEVSQNDLKELGFDYTVGYNKDNMPYGSYNPSTNAIPGYNSNRLSFNDSMTGLMRNSGNGELFVLNGVAGGENGFAYSAKVYAASQMNSSDTLASPRVTTIAGMPAHIEMVREIRFVDEYDDGEFQSSSTSSDISSTSYQTFTTIGPFPDFDDAEKLGIIMDVTPEVDKARRTIRVRMAPQVRSFLGYTEFTSTDASGNIELMRKPIIDERTIDTTVTVYDGETLVLGGVIDDTSTAQLDKIPILGDLPIIGRLFQSRYTNGEKKNLLIFMTCRLVKPDGAPFYPSERTNRGVPKHGRLE